MVYLYDNDDHDMVIVVIFVMVMGPTIHIYFYDEIEQS